MKKMKKIQNNESGFTLVELLIASLLLLILIGPLLSFMRAGQINRSTAIRLTDVEQNVRTAMLAIGRDIGNAGFNFAPTVPVRNSQIVRTLTGLPPATDSITPIIPGNNLNLVRTIDFMNNTVTNASDQITVIASDQAFNNGLPLSGQITPTGNRFTSNAPFNGLFPGDFVILSRGAQVATAVVNSINGNDVMLTDSANPDTFGLNQPGAGPLSLINPLPQTAAPTTLYRFFLITYFVDGNGNLIRREHFPPPHTAAGGNNSRVPVALATNTNTYNCGLGATCFIDNIIATGIEDLQFTYYLFEPQQARNINGPVDDPGMFGVAANGGTAPTYRMLDIRQVNVSIKARAAERDTKIRDRYNNNQGYLYRFSLDGTFNTRNFYGSDFRPF
jgi:type II secretory pathway pseudopilin PulG